VYITLLINIDKLTVTPNIDVFDSFIDDCVEYLEYILTEEEKDYINYVHFKENGKTITVTQFSDDLNLDNY
jgi:hypothetical protein